MPPSAPPITPATSFVPRFCKPHLAPTAFSTHRRQLLTQAPRAPVARLRSTPNDDDPPPEPTKEKSEKKDPEEYYVESLKKIGVDQTAAKRILKVWKEAGVDDPDALRRLYLKGSLRPIGVGIGQALLDLGAAAGSFSAATAFGAMADFPFQLGVEAVCYFVGFYFVSNLFFDVITLGVVAYSVAKFGTNPEAYVRAVEKIAGEFAVVAKVQATVDAFKVVQALNTIADVLREEKSSIVGEDNPSTLSNLSEYLVFVRAKEELGFDPAAYNLSDEDASRIVNQFNKYDLNDDGVLEVRELGNLCDSLGQTFTEDELTAAMKIVDTDKSGVIEFNEFVDWWVNKVSPDQVKE